MLRILLCLLVATVTLASPGVNFEFSEEELARYFGISSHDEAPDYEIVYPEFVAADGKRSVGRNAIAASHLEVHVNAFGQVLRMALEHDDSNIRPGLEAEYITDIGSFKVPVRTDCLYTGKVVGEGDSLVSVTTCTGLMAVMYHASGPTYIEPLDEEHALKRDIGRGLPHVAYKKVPRRGAHCPVTEDSKYVKSKQEETIGDQMEDINPQATKYLELAFIGDSELYSFRGSNTHNCLTTLFNAAKNVLQHSSLVGTALIPKLVDVKVFTSSETGLKTCPDQNQALNRACDWQLANNPPASDPKHWDNAVVLTGWQMKSGGTLGVAWPGHCGDWGATSLTNFRTWDATDTVCHEIGHNLDMSHDGNGNSCPNMKYMMASKALDYRSEPIWSTCSRDAYKSFVGRVSCYDDS